MYRYSTDTSATTTMISSIPIVRIIADLSPDYKPTAALAAQRPITTPLPAASRGVFLSACIWVFCPRGEAVARIIAVNAD
jgi:hypothetical protein